jgi:hypothetical protein
MFDSRHTRVPVASLTLATICCAIALLCATALAPAARAEVNGFGPDESIAGAAGPLVPATPYVGAFASASDIDYLYFEVPQAETLRFDFENTLSRCQPYWIEEAGEPRLYEPLPSCPLWGTLLEAGGQQLGGEGSGAGTGPVEYHSYEEVEWAFPTPGRYYIVLESEYCGGHPKECELPTFKLSYAVVPAGGGGTGGGGTGGSGGTTGSGGSTGAGGKTGAGAGQGTGSKGGEPKSGEVGVFEGHPSGSFAVSGSRSLIESLTLSKRQRGRRVTVTVVLARRLESLELELLAPSGPHHSLRLVGRRLRRHPLAGRERISVPVRAGRWLTRQRYVPLLLRVRAQAENGAAELVQGRLLLRL